jgi:hypothetical protein
MIIPNVDEVRRGEEARTKAVATPQNALGKCARGTLALGARYMHARQSIHLGPFEYRVNLKLFLAK